MNAHHEKTIEDIIALFKANENEYDLEAAIAKFENNFEEQQFYAQQLVLIYKLLERKRSSRLFHLTEPGILFKGFEEMRNAERMEKETSRQLLWYNTENAKQVFEDYPNIKKKSNYTIAIAAASMIISALLAIKSCSK